MQIVIQKDVALATHADDQNLAGRYPASCQILHAPDGTPVRLGEPVGSTALAALAEYDRRARRQAALDASDWIIARHRDQLDLVAAGLLEIPTLTDAEYQAWLAYRQAWRDLPMTGEVQLPVAPEGA